MSRPALTTCREAGQAGGAASYAVYIYSQLIVGEEYLRLPGNNERWFPLLYTAFVLGGALLVTAWRAVDAARLPATPRWLDRLTGVVLLVVAGHLVLGLHLPSIVDALRDHPSRVEYLSTPTPFWLVKLMDLGIVVPVAVAAGIGLLRGAAWARKPMYAVVGAYALLTVAVTGMAVMMLVRHDPDASVVQAVAFGGFPVAFCTLAALLYRPLLRGPAAAAPLRAIRPRTCLTTLAGGSIGPGWPAPVTGCPAGSCSASVLAGNDRVEGRVAGRVRGVRRTGLRKDHVQPVGPAVRSGRTLLTNECRTATTDPVSRRRFARYWWVIRPFVGHIMRTTVAEIGADAVRRAGAAARAHAEPTVRR
jgi:hypothetical protein